MYKLILALSFFSLFACSAPMLSMKVTNASPKSITINNIKSTKQGRVKAYRAAEVHCAKYYKVPRILSPVNQEQVEAYQTKLHSTKFECLKPSN